MPAIYRHSLTVPAAAIDAQGHVNNLEYIRWMQDAAVAHSAVQGWPSERYQEIGAGWVVREHKIQYQAPGFADDEIVVLTWVASFHKIRSLRRYKFIRPADEAVLAVAETEWAFIGLEHHVPRRVPAELREAFEIVPDSEAP